MGTTETTTPAAMPSAEHGDAYWLRCAKCKNTTVPHIEKSTAREIGYGLGWRSVKLPGGVSSATLCPECLKRPLSDLTWEGQ